MNQSAQGRRCLTGCGLFCVLLNASQSLVEKIGSRPAAESANEIFRRRKFDPVRDAPLFPADDVYSLLDPAPGASNVYEMREIIARIVDRGEFDEYKAEFGRTVLCGYAWIG